MEKSILTSIKALLGITEEDTSFDMQIVTHINSVFMILKQLGVGPEDGFYIEDETMDWEDFISNDLDCQAVKSYMYAKVKMIFDPPDRAAVLDALQRTINEFEWRLNLDAETTSE